MRIVQPERLLQCEAEISQLVLGLRVILVELDALDGAAVVRDELSFESVQGGAGREADDVIEEGDVEEFEVHAHPALGRSHEDGIGERGEGPAGI